MLHFIFILSFFFFAHAFSIREKRLFWLHSLTQTKPPDDCRLVILMDVQHLTEDFLKQTQNAYDNLSVILFLFIVLSLLYCYNSLLLLPVFSSLVCRWEIFYLAFQRIIYLLLFY